MSHYQFPPDFHERDNPLASAPHPNPVETARAAEVTMSMGIAKVLGESPLAPVKQAQVALRAAAIVLATMPESQSARGKLINTACEEFRRALQATLPLPGFAG